MHGLGLVQCRGTITLWLVTLWLTYEADKGGGTGPPGGMAEAIINKPVRNMDVQENIVESLVDISQVDDKIALNSKGILCVKLEDDQGGGL